jgi:hypothetical protein
VESPAEIAQEMVNKIKLRAIFIAIVIHLGLISAIVGLVMLPRPEGMELSHWLTLAGLAGVYGGLALGILMVVLPLASTIRRVRRVLQWRDWILDELPRIIALLPSVLEAIRAFFESLSKGGTVYSAMSDAAKQAAREGNGTPAATPGMTVDVKVDVPSPGTGQKPPHSVA